MLYLVIYNEFGGNIGEYPIPTGDGITGGVVKVLQTSYALLVEGDSMRIERRD